MIGSVAIDGAELALGDVVAAVSIRHGRGGADEGPLASTCALRLINRTRADALAFRTEVELRIELEDGTPRFVGRVTDGALSEDGLSVIATSSLGWVVGNTVGAVDWPEEAWSSRVRRAFAEAGAGNTWANVAGTWAEQPIGETWAAPFGDSPLFTLELGDSDPIVVARAAAPTTLSGYLPTLLADVPATVANLPDGSVLVQALEYRKGLAVVPLDPNLVAFAPEWAKVSDVENVATVTYGAELETTAIDAASVDEFREQPVEISTDLRDEADASSLAREHVYRYGVSDWLVDAAELLELETAIAIGTPVELSELPEWSPYATRVGMVEGWEDVIDVHEATGALEWSMRLALSSPRLSGVAQDWTSVPAGETWADVAAGVTWNRPDTIF